MSANKSDFWGVGVVDSRDLPGELNYDTNVKDHQANFLATEETENGFHLICHYSRRAL